MIRYQTGSFGFALLFRLHGSAVFRSFIPALVSSIIYAVLLRTTDLETDEGQIYKHPYAMGALVAALTFLLAFRANFSYNRYWEAFTAVHQMHSKWMDVGMDMAAFHLQSSKYDKRRPPAFGEHPDLTCLERERERNNEPTLSEVEEKIDDIMAQQEQAESKLSLRHRVRSVMMVNAMSKDFHAGGEPEASDSVELKKNESTALAVNTAAAKDVPAADTTTPSTQSSTQQPGDEHKHSLTSFLGGVFNKNGTPQETPPRAEIVADNAPAEERGLNLPVQIKTNTKNQTKAWRANQPPLLLQEGAHLLSLLSAVAMSTLRNDLEEADSPLIAFTPGAPWPHVDPDAYGADVRKDWTHSSHRCWTVFSFLFGLSRTPAHRTLYNAARPFRVIGGVSDAEIECLQAARGPYAKVALCTMWLEEFATREHLNGGMGAIGAPIVSRLFQFTSDGMIGYNQARKIAYIPFPFPHAQITSLFVLVVVGLMPILMLSFLEKEEYGFVANLLTVMCFTGLHEVSRELENPFQNVPNDIPLNNFQAQFNEGLMQMFAGYHPDAYWEIHQQIEEDNVEAGKTGSYPPSKERLESMSSKEPSSAMSNFKDETKTDV